MTDMNFSQYDPSVDFTSAEDEDIDGETTFPHPFGSTKDQLFEGENPKEERAKPLVELEMVRLSASLRSKPQWWIKYANPEIRARWKAEALAQAGTMHEEYIEYVLAELDGYAALRDDASGIEVGCYDRIWHSDKLVPEELHNELIAHVRALEDVPEAEKDWHPRSNGQVLDLVHPSLYPVVYGRTLQVRNLGRANERERVIKPPEHVDFDKDEDEDEIDDSEDYEDDPSLSRRFMWLPTDFQITTDGAKALGYINNLHPITHSGLHKTIERIVAVYVPLFQHVLADLLLANKEWVTPARVNNQYSYNEEYAPRPYSTPIPQNTEAEAAMEAAMEAWYAARPIILSGVKGSYEKGSLEKRIQTFKLAGRTVQIITKLANIHLTPENPVYPGGTWHVEGMKNEAIAASGIYYYDEDNITESRLAFRTAVGIPATSYQQEDFRGCKLMWGISRDEACNQLLGSVATSKGRALAFPNIYQHQVSSFQLADPTRPGHRKILALFLVDPVLSSRSPLPSTTTVPPQQAHWRSDPSSSNENSPSMLRRVAGVAHGSMTKAEAKIIRLQLMDERTAFTADNDAIHFSVPFSMSPATPDKQSRSASPESPQFKLRPAESGDAAPVSEAAGDDQAEGDASVPPAQQSDVTVDAAQESLMFMLNAVQQIHQQNQQANAAALAHPESTEESTDEPAAQAGTPPPMQDLQLDPALMGPGAPGQQPSVPPQQQHLPGQPPHPHQIHPHHPHMHQATMMAFHHPPQYIASPYPPPGGHAMPPPPELQQIPQPAVRTTRSGRAGTIQSGDDQYEDDGEEGDSSFVDTNGQVPSGPSAESPAQPAAPGNKKGKWATSDTVDWQRKRKDNHKEVERRRRSNINDGINELARMVPNVGAEKAKGAILSRSVQYIHDLKENEARNIEKWTLEKLLMDQAMGDLQAQLDEMRQRLEEERQRREQVEAQLAETLRMQQERAVHEEPGAKRARVE
ncbi:hypothetical protein FRC07_015187 [Ceratobasidium sp. 392]|nr:hypothetical protein FRC07_015187 [Ceratobasidium sp. 392]